MTLAEWAASRGWSDREIAEAMTAWLKGHDPDSRPVSLQSVQKYRTGRVPSDVARMQAIYHVTKGWVTANDFFDLPTVTL